MAKIYFDLIKKQLRTIEQVPNTWREETQQLLDNSEVL